MSEIDITEYEVYLILLSVIVDKEKCKNKSCTSK